MASIFTRIIRGELPCYKIYEDELFFAFLDIKPIRIGHTLLVPKQEIDYYFDLKPQILADLTVVSQKIAVAIKQIVPCRKIGVAVCGIEVPHAHLHLIPVDKVADMNFANAAPAKAEDLASIAEKIRQKLA
ncbi:MAG: HIT family protein [Candidatus Omnitrophica bacterium]|nr:HIT family protein [Candidatus Omnitrophota bacterium]